jgi:hypothetical protein
MGALDKLAFWKKKDDFDLGKDFGADLGLGQPGTPDLGPSPYAPPNAGLDQNMNIGMPPDTGFGNMGQAPPQKQMQPPGQPAPMQQPFGAPMQPTKPTEHDHSNDKFEVVSAKLDSIRYTLESINQRLANLERVAYGEHEKKKW